MTKEELFLQIIAIEWEMFDTTKNVGERAPYQDDKTGFVASRKCQLFAWSETLLESYLADLKAAKEAGRNLMAEKYARMMEPIYTGEYNELEPLLPRISAEKGMRIDQIMEVQMQWAKEAAEEYPLLSSFGRPRESRQDSVYNTSVETYLWSELTTYSENTLRAYAGYIAELKFRKKNLHEMILQNTAQVYGFASARAAEDSLRQRLREQNQDNYLKCYDRNYRE